MNTTKWPYLLLLPLTLLGCQQGNENEDGLASTHPELAEDLAKDSLTVPYNDSTDRDLYDRYRISTEQYLNSGDYNVGNIYRGKLAPLDESSHTDAHTHRAVLQQGLEQGVNFAGKYTVVSIGCGTNCQEHFVIDRETGKVLDKIQSSTGASFNAQNHLFIVNPPDSAINYNACADCEPVAYKFENMKFQQLEQQP
ncbi:hypothetical protein [uncultured Pontibacter sp.]|uniref:hypothetical protein n=1 Tax=uncultured Pontibacter sp. TaxID=453356 RepID=UPI00261CE38F|nr:hypothetical protein [uncultured Pontibacter sp.]